MLWPSASRQCGIPTFGEAINVPSKNVLDSGPGTSDIEIREYLRYSVYAPQAAVKDRRAQFQPTRSSIASRKSDEEREGSPFRARIYSVHKRANWGSSPTANAVGKGKVANVAWNLVRIGTIPLHQVSYIRSIKGSVPVEGRGHTEPNKISTRPSGVYMVALANCGKFGSRLQLHEPSPVIARCTTVHNSVLSAPQGKYDKP